MNNLLSTLYNILYKIIVNISIYIGKIASRAKFKEDQSSWSTKINIFKLKHADLINRIFSYGVYVILTIALISFLKKLWD